MLSFCRFWHISPLDYERLAPWLREEMTAYAVRVQSEERRQARRARG